MADKKNWPSAYATLSRKKKKKASLEGVTYESKNWHGFDDLDPGHGPSLVTERQRALALKP